MCIISFKLRIDLIDVVYRVAPFASSRVHHVDHHLRALNVAKELVSQPYALRCSFNKPRYVCDNESFRII